jgi:hypothetical protein
LHKWKVERASELVQVYRAAGGSPRFSTPLRYALAVVVVAVAVGVILLLEAVFHKEPVTFVELIVAVVFSSRYLGAGPGWLTAALAAAYLAWELPPDGSFAIDPQYYERFIGTVGAYIAILLFRSRSLGGSPRLFRAHRASMIRRISSLITRGLTSLRALRLHEA